MINLSKKISINVILLVVCALTFSTKANAQQVTVINQKGTKIDVVNNVVTTSDVAPPNPLVADVWFDNTDVSNVITKIWDGTLWIEIKSADSGTTNEIQDLSLTANTLSLTGDATTVDLSGYLDNTDSQILTFTSPNLAISEGNSVNLSALDTKLTESEVDTFVSNNGYLTSEVDGSVTNEIQTLSISGNNLSISGGNTVTIPTSGTSTTDVQGAGINVVSGDGSTATPYVVTGTEVDGDVTNEGTLTVAVGGANTSEIHSNTSGSSNVVISGEKGIRVTESGNTITIGGPIAMGKVNSTGTAAKIYGANVQRTNLGRYTVTFSNAMLDANYIIQLTLLKSSATEHGFIAVTAQNTSSFDIEIYYFFDKKLNKTNIDLPWYFTVQDF